MSLHQWYLPTMPWTLHPYIHTDASFARFVDYSKFANHGLVSFVFLIPCFHHYQFIHFKQSSISMIKPAELMIFPSASVADTDRY